MNFGNHTNTWGFDQSEYITKVAKEHDASIRSPMQGLIIL